MRRGIPRRDDHDLEIRAHRCDGDCDRADELRPAPGAAAPEGGPAIVKQNAGADEISAQRKRRRGRVQSGRAARGVRRDRRHDRRRRGGRTIGAPTTSGYYHAPRYGYDEAGLWLRAQISGPPAYQYAPPAYRSRPATTARLLQPLGRLGRPARLSRPERERAGADELRQRRGPERPGAAAVVNVSAAAVMTTSHAKRRPSGRRLRAGSHILRRKFTC